MTTHRFSLLVLMIVGGCTMDNPAFDETRQTVADESGSDDGHAELEAGEGDGDADSGSGDGGSGTSTGDGDSGDGDSSTDTSNGETETGNDMPCEGLGPIDCDQKDDCVAVHYNPVEQLPEGFCIAPPNYDGCLSMTECDLPTSLYWCNDDQTVYIKVELDGCLPSVVAAKSLDTCMLPDDSPSECAP
ncbi:hypothetical protein ENSA5_21980 [Enhygromyxa salina]|uniref:Endo-1,4-beta-xylanase A n=1 Tax=Enhygromyxa salina TaxID=215803 RepID=A0A2S9YBS5_9BACT|nr:hypothetical protein [Enhygromyxa salina]PRQ02553.1 hypothetical protein ENSA5_21980 [Enhygromyxa salina]